MLAHLSEPRCQSHVFAVYILHSQANCEMILQKHDCEANTIFIFLPGQNNQESGDKLLKLLMESASRLVGALMKATNNNTVIDICLVGSFLALCYRSVKQQKDIEAMEAEKNTLIKSNKDMKKAMWDWKQQLFAEASSESALVPLSRLKVIYGESPAPQIGTHFVYIFYVYVYFECMILEW